MRPRYSSFRIDSTDRGMVLLLDDDFESSAPAARVGERSWVSNSEENLLAKCSYSERKKLCKRNFSNQKNKLSSRIDFVCIDFWWEEKICQQKTVFILIACNHSWMMGSRENDMYVQLYRDSHSIAEWVIALSVIEMTKEGWCPNPGDGIDLSKGRYEMCSYAEEDDLGTWWKTFS